MAETTPAFTSPTIGTPDTDESQFAFAKIKEQLFLVLISQITPTLSEPSLALEVKFFKHEFITIFRYSHCDIILSADINILEFIEASFTRYEEGSGTVFLAKDVMKKLQKLTERL